jgi:hypothetical protein
MLSETSGRPYVPVLAVSISRAAFANDLPCEEKFQSPGLLATYYGGKAWDGPVIQRRVEDWPYRYEQGAPTFGSVEWRGFLRTPVAGRYGFHLVTGLGATGKVAIGSAIAIDSQQPVDLQLDAREYPISIRCRPERPASFCWLQWEPPGGPEALIPSEFLWPPSVTPGNKPLPPASR